MDAIRDNAAIIPAVYARPPAKTGGGGQQPPEVQGDRSSLSGGDGPGRPGGVGGLISALTETFGGEQPLDKEKAADLSESDQQELARLRRRDTAVKDHEEAHYREAGEYARSGPEYDMKTGPDGKQYRDGGKVMIDVAETDDPEKTIRKMQQVRRSALAPAHIAEAPLSDADLNIAAEATAKEQKAQGELAQRRAG